MWAVRQKDCCEGTHSSFDEIGACCSLTLGTSRRFNCLRVTNGAVWEDLIRLRSASKGAQLVEALRCKPGGRGFDSRWCHWNFDVEYIYGFVRWGGLQAKSMTSQRAAFKMADMRYYCNVMTTTRWRLCVTMFYIFNSTVIDWTCYIFSFT